MENSEKRKIEAKETETENAEIVKAEIREAYCCRCASAYVRTKRAENGDIAKEETPKEESKEPTDAEDLILQGLREGLKLYHFKKSHAELLRVRRVLGFLKSVPFESLLNVGSGRGAFLIPFLEQFPYVSVTAVDLLPDRVEFLDALRRGGIHNLSVQEADICMRPLPEKSVDVVTLLEVLEHIPKVDEAVKAAVEIARKYVVVTVPSREDDNPEHIHLLTKDRLTEFFEATGCNRLRFDGVPGHTLLIATV